MPQYVATRPPQPRQSFLSTLLMGLAAFQAGRGLSHAVFGDSRRQPFDQTEFARTQAQIAGTYNPESPAWGNRY